MLSTSALRMAVWVMYFMRQHSHLVVEKITDRLQYLIQAIHSYQKLERFVCCGMFTFMFFHPCPTWVVYSARRVSHFGVELHQEKKCCPVAYIEYV